jgi:hypothetical protein
MSSQSQSYITTDSQLVSVLVSGTHLGPVTNFSHSFFDYFFGQFRVCLMWGGLSGEKSGLYFSVMLYLEFVYVQYIY